MAKKEVVGWGHILKRVFWQGLCKHGDPQGEGLWVCAMATPFPWQEKVETQATVLPILHLPSCYLTRVHLHFEFLGSVNQNIIYRPII